MPKSIPSELMKNGRLEDQDFSADAEFYWRFNLILGGKPDISQIKFNQSTNRSKYCANPEWILVTETGDYSDWSFGAIAASKAEFCLTSTGNVNHFFSPWHAPIETNYSHTEIQAFRDLQKSQRVKKTKNRELKAAFRLSIRLNTDVLRIGSGTKCLP